MRAHPIHTGVPVLLPDVPPLQPRTLCCRCGDRAVVQVCSLLEDAALCAACWTWLAAPAEGVHLEPGGRRAADGAAAAVLTSPIPEPGAPSQAL